MSLLDISATDSQEQTTQVCRTCHRTVVVILAAGMLKQRTKSDDSLESNTSANSEAFSNKKKLRMADESLEF